MEEPIVVSYGNEIIPPDETVVTSLQQSSTNSRLFIRSYKMSNKKGWKINNIVSIDFSYNLKTFALIVIVYVFFLKFSLEIPLMDVFRRINLPIEMMR